MDPTKVVEYHLDLLKKYSNKEEYSQSSLLLEKNVTNASSSSLSSSTSATSTSSLSSLRSSSSASSSSTSRISSTSSASSTSSFSSTSLKGCGNGDGETESINIISNYSHNNNNINNSSSSNSINNDRNNNSKNNNNHKTLKASTPINFNLAHNRHQSHTLNANHSSATSLSHHQHNQPINQIKKIFYNSKSNVNKNLNKINHQKIKKSKNNVYDILKKTANCDAHAKFKDFSIENILKSSL